MLRSILIGTCLGIGVILLRNWVFSPQEVASQPVAPSPTRELPQIAGLPYEEAQAIVERHRSELMKIPGVQGISIRTRGLLIQMIIYSETRTIDPEVLKIATRDIPATIEGLPVKVKALPILPPPPGVIVLWPETADQQRQACPPGLLRSWNGRFVCYAHAETCPSGLEEMQQFGWRVCLDSSETIPALWEPPIAGIPFDEAMAILERHREELMRLPGVQGIGLGAEGIAIEAPDPAVFPSSVEGLPVIVTPPPVVKRFGLNHTYGAQIRPVHGGVQFGPSGNGGTLTGVVLSEGKPWLVFPAHLLSNCGATPNCAIPTLFNPLNSCPHTLTGNGETIYQPSSMSAPIGRSERWDHLVAGGTTSDAAAAFMDNNTIEGDGSLSTNREIDSWSRGFTGLDRLPAMSETMHIRIANTPHNVDMDVNRINYSQTLVSYSCIGYQTLTLRNQLRLVPGFGNVLLTLGDSGAPFLNDGGDIIGALSWFGIDVTTGDVVEAGGTLATEIRNTLDFDQWYGTQTANDNSFGTFRPSQGRWYLDNGDGRWQSTTPGEWQINYGTTGDRALSGSWNGGLRCLGVYRPSQGRFYLDSNCDGVTDTTITMGIAEDLPIAGDWNNDGKTDVGLWRPSTKTFYLDFNGNKVWDGCAVDKCFTYGLSTDKPVAGNWGGSPGNAAKTGVYRPSEGKWYLEKDNNGWQTGQEIIVGPFGLSDDKPVIGNWTGVGTKDKIGVFHTTGGGIVPPATWVLDNGDGAFTSYQREQRLGPFGLAEDQPVAWRKTVWKGN